MSPRNHVMLRRALFVPVLTILICGPCIPAFAGNDAKILDDAKEHYMFGRFEHTIYLLSECVKNPDIELAIELEAYQYIGKAYVALQQEQDAINSIRILLSLVPDYEPDQENDKQEYRSGLPGKTGE